jgi:hypothetical protein
MEKLGKPAVMTSMELFYYDARSAAARKGMATLRIVPTSLTQLPTDNDEGLRKGVSAIIDDIVTALTKQPTEKEKYPAIEANQPQRIIFEGNLQEVNTFFYKRGWAYGMPIIPPTEEAVEEMLTGTDLPADYVVAQIPPRFGKATVEKIAVNGVMAGTLPIYMPVLIAATQALVDPRWHSDCYTVSIASWAPFWIINGPIRHDLHLNNGVSLVTPEWKANAAIAHAMGLIIKNLGGVRPGIEDMGAMGYEGKYNLCIAENEEESPWEPLHVEHGLKKEDSAVTVFFPNARSWLVHYGEDADGILRALCRIPYQGHLIGFGGMIISPDKAKALADAGWTKREVISYVRENARVPAYSISLPSEGQVGSEWVPKELRPVDPNFTVRLITTQMTFESFEPLKIIVAGRLLAVLYSGFMPHYGGWITKKIELPKKWDQLVKKYKGIVPTYTH